MTSPLQGMGENNKGEVRLELHLFTQEISPVLDRHFTAFMIID